MLISVLTFPRQWGAPTVGPLNSSNCAPIHQVRWARVQREWEGEEKRVAIWQTAWVATHDIQGNTNSSTLHIQSQFLVQDFHSKNKTPVLGNEPVLGEKLKRGITYFGYFLRKAFVKPYHPNGFGENSPLMWLNMGLCWKIIKIRTTRVLVSQPQQV